MNKRFLILAFAGLASASRLLAQQDNIDLFKQLQNMEGDKKADAQQPAPVGDQKDATIITATKDSSFDQKEHLAVFSGDVKVQNPQFTLTAEKLTVYLKKDAETKQAPGGKPAAKPSATPKPAATAAPGAPSVPGGGGGIEKIVAEGNVVVVSDRPDNNGQPTHYVGKCQKLEYNPATGEAVMRGWPQIQQGINTIEATESTTVIFLNREGSMDIKYGGQRTVVHDPGPDKQPTPVTPQIPKLIQ